MIIREVVGRFDVEKAFYVLSNLDKLTREKCYASVFGAGNNITASISCFDGEITRLSIEVTDTTYRVVLHLTERETEEEINRKKLTAFRVATDVERRITALPIDPKGSLKFAKHLFK